MTAARRSPDSLDCQTCGACCCNTNENRAENYPWYVEIEPGSELMVRPHLVRKYVAFDREQSPHMRLTPDGRCKALQGRLGENVHCEVYAHRPRGCRRVQPGDPDCLLARRERGLDPA